MRTEYSMRGWRGMLVVCLGILFVAPGTYAWFTMVHGTSEQQWTLIVPGSFILFGLGLLFSGCYAAMRNVRYAFEVTDSVIRWERVDQNKEIGRIALESVEQIRFLAGGGDSQDSLQALSKCGEVHVIPLEFIDGDQGRRAFFEYLAANFPEIRIRED
jgi:hypothetical protein